MDDLDLIWLNGGEAGLGEGVDNLLLESGDNLLLESGDVIKLEAD